MVLRCLRIRSECRLSCLIIFFVFFAWCLKWAFLAFFCSLLLRFSALSICLSALRMARDLPWVAHDDTNKKMVNNQIMNPFLFFIVAKFWAKVTIFRQIQRFSGKIRYFAPMKRPVLHLLILMAILPLLHGCEKYPEK